MLVEVCANSLQSALNAEKAGADRIELCSELAVGGITPSYGLLKKVKEKVTIPIHVLIRPRSGDFTFSEDEYEIMKKDIALCRDMGFEGVVAGILYEDLRLDIDRTSRLKEAAGPMKFTFHRAFDWVVEPFMALEELENIGVDYILSSGQQNSAPEGIAMLETLHQKAASCKIMPGSGIRPENIRKFAEIGFNAVHLSAVKFERTLKQTPKVSMNSPAFLKDNEIGISDFETIGRIVNEVK
ncbi:copper homeostasis protein CutC [Maribacter algicola]|uniref:Copper homeostasis protein CutC n=1 Tax=Meishania litoralis TaxID=3434685 RepID=A0ACC7LFL1_9FLAO